ncbi:MAG: phosphatase PAP2 family protein [Chloroflexi bacterium]|nr:phosphatase PAP2 family protein [Chloroflexota bacterium]
MLASHLWYRPRPFVAHANVVHLLLAHSPDASFPSDHAAAGFAIAVVLAGSYPKSGAVALIYAALMSYARVYVGEHYPGDVLAGAAIGVACAALLLTWLYPVARFARRLVDAAIRLLHIPLPRTA